MEGMVADQSGAASSSPPQHPQQAADMLAAEYEDEDGDVRGERACHDLLHDI